MDNKKNFHPFYVVDGQQRLTTSLILIQAIIESVTPKTQINYTSISDIRKRFIFEAKKNGVSRAYIFGYEKDNPSYEYLKIHIFKEKSDKHSVEENTVYTQNLSYAKKFFCDKIKELDKPQIESVFKKITQKFLSIYIQSLQESMFLLRLKR